MRFYWDLLADEKSQFLISNCIDGFETNVSPVGKLLWSGRVCTLDYYKLSIMELFTWSPVCHWTKNYSFDFSSFRERKNPIVIRIIIMFPKGFTKNIILRTGESKGSILFWTLYFVPEFNSVVSKSRIQKYLWGHAHIRWPQKARHKKAIIVGIRKDFFIGYDLLLALCVLYLGFLPGIIWYCTQRRYIVCIRF